MDGQTADGSLWDERTWLTLSTAEPTIDLMFSSRKT